MAETVRGAAVVEVVRVVFLRGEGEHPEHDPCQ